MTNLDLAKDLARQWTNLLKDMDKEDSMRDYCKGTLDGIICIISILENKKYEVEK